jgi:chromosome segregation ATPase
MTRIAHTGCMECGPQHSAIDALADALASLERSNADLKREIQKWEVALTTDLNTPLIQIGKLKTENASLLKRAEAAERERDEARRLHDEHCPRRQGIVVWSDYCEPTWRKQP